MFFNKLKKLYDKEELEREKVILKSRKIVSLSKEIITLPMFPTMSNSEVEYVVSQLKIALKRFR